MADSPTPRPAEGRALPPQEVEKGLQIQTALNAILRTSLWPISLDEQMHRTLGLILNLPWLALEAKGCIFLAEEGARTLAMKAQIGMPSGALSVCGRVPFGQCICGQAITAGDVLFVDCVDARHGIRYPGMVPHGHYCVPIRSGKRPIGLLNLYVREGHRRSPDEERFLRAAADVLAGVIERKQTEERLQEQMRLAAFGRDVGLALSQADNLPDMLRRCAEAMVRDLDAALARVWTLDKAEGVLELQASAGLYTHTDGGHSRVPVGQYKIGRIAQERRPHLTNAVLTDPRVHDPEWARREGLVAFAGYPLLVEDRLVGVASMFARHPLSEATLEAMASVANAIALGVERLRADRARRQAERRSAAEHAVSQILAASSCLNDAASNILQAVCETLDWDVGTAWVADTTADVLRCAAIWHRPGIDVAAFEDDTRQRTFAPGVGMPGRVWADERLVWVPDVSADANFPRQQVASQCGLHGAVGFPIRNGGQVLGALEFCSQEIRQPDDEVTQMMTSIGRQVSQFIERRQAEGELRRQEEDRRIARRIQQALLPRAMPAFAGLRVHGRSLPANEVGGDCFDFIPLPDGGEVRLGVVVADASGHGIGAALLMAETRAYLRALSLTCADASTLLALTNRRLAADLVRDHFVTLLLLLLDPRDRSLVYGSAGHCAGYVLGRQGTTRAVLASTALPLGIDAAAEFPTGPPVRLGPGELLFLFTDGVVEGGPPDGGHFGLGRALDIVRAHRHETPEAILDALFEAVLAFSGHQLRDDLTAVIIQAEGTA